MEAAGAKAHVLTVHWGRQQEFYTLKTAVKLKEPQP